MWFWVPTFRWNLASIAPLAISGTGGAYSTLGSLVYFLFGIFSFRSFLLIFKKETLLPFQEA